MVAWFKNYYLHLSLVIFGFILRIINIANPKKFSMDEVWYVPDGYSMFKNGYEVRWLKSYNGDWTKELQAMFVSGNLEPYDLSYISTHPPFGKFLIGLGMLFFEPTNPFGWRIASVIFGSTIIALSMVLAYLLFKNKTVSLLAGLFIAIDPAMIAMSKTAMLDIFLTAFVLAGMIFVIKYVNTFKIKYLFIIGIFFGLASAIKLSGVFFFLSTLLFISIKLLYDKKFKNILSLFFVTTSTLLLTYVLTWSSWFINYAFKQNENPIWIFVKTHYVTLTDAKNIISSHPYKTSAIEWLWLARPTGLSVNNTSSEYVYSMPNVFFWFAGIASLIGVLVFLVRKKLDYNVSLLLFAVLAGWLPWVFVGNRTIFEFYIVAFLPYIFISLAGFGYICYILAKSEILKKIIRISLLFCMFFTVLLYPTAVGIPIPENNLLFKNIPAAYMETVKQYGLYNTQQSEPLSSSEKTSSNISESEK